MSCGSAHRLLLLLIHLSLVAVTLVGCGDAPSTTADEAEGAGFIEPTLLPRLDELIRSEARRLGIPGAAWAVVAGDSIRHTATYGVRNSQRSLPVTPRTLFGATSVTQAMTTSMMAALVDGQQIGWDAEIGLLQSNLEWPSAEWAQSVRLVDLLSMTSGLGQHVGKGASSVREVIESISALPIEAAPGDRFLEQPESFCGATFAVAAAALGEELGRHHGYQRLMQSHLFAPAGMRHSAIGFRLSAMSDNYATAYQRSTGGDGPLVEAEILETPGFDPWAGVASSIEDLGRFVILHMRDGIAESGQRVASHMNLVATRELRVALPAEACGWPGAQSCGGSMGWRIAELANEDRLVMQGGSANGFSAAVAFLEQRRVGIAIAANAGGRAGGGEFIEATRMGFFELLLGPTPHGES